MTKLVNEWLQRLLMVRDAAMNLPPFPAMLWLIGGLIAFALMVARVQHSRRIIQRSTVAPADIGVMVAKVASQLNLRRVPVALVTQSRISPMVFCSVSPRLVLPSELWAQLDNEGRRAILVHELAHLKRRDHLWCWIELIIGCMYWWHPVVWWIRRRLRDEADDCCDAWVTALMPRSRRAYAQALLETQKFTSAAHAIIPAVGLGGPGRSSRKLARRLTMVMTHNFGHRLSARGMALCMAIGIAAYLAAPLLACPPEDPSVREKRAIEAQTRKEREAVRALAVPRAPKPPKTGQHAAPSAPPVSDTDDETTFERYMRGLEEQQIDQLPPQQQLEHYRRRIEELERNLEQMHRRTTAPSRRVAAAAPHAVMNVSCTSPAITSTPTSKVVTADNRAFHTTGTGVSAASSATGHAAIACGPGIGALAGDEPMVRTYAVSNTGKLDALIALLGRQDVPLQIERNDKSITVRASLQAHTIFNEFLMMIDGRDNLVQIYSLSPAKLKALTDLMVRNDVPLLVERGSDHIAVHGCSLEQLIFSAFVRLIDTDDLHDVPTVSVRALGTAAHIQQAAEAELAARLHGTGVAAQDSTESRAPLERELQKLQRARVVAPQPEMREAAQQQQRLRALLAEHRAASRKLESQATQLFAEAERLHELVEQLQEQAETLSDAAEHFTGNDRLQLIQKARELEVRAREAERHAAELERRAEELESRHDAVDDQIESLEDQRDNLDEDDLEDDDTAG